MLPCRVLFAIALVMTIVFISLVPRLDFFLRASISGRVFEESLQVLVLVLVKMPRSFSIISFLHLNRLARMVGMPHLYASMPQHIEKLADFRVLLLPIFPLTGLGTIQGRLAFRTVFFS